MAVYVLQQLVEHPGFVSQLGFARMAAPIVCQEPGVGAEVTSRGLRLLGESEAALAAAARTLAERFDGATRARAPEVIYLQDPWREPYMRAMATAPAELEGALTALLARRLTETVGVARHAATVTVCAVGPLAGLLGLQADLAKRLPAAELLGIVFSHHEVVQDDPPGGEAA